MSLHSTRRAHGFSLVELMVSVVIGLLAILFATRIMTDGERNKDAAMGGSDSMQNGMLAMFQIGGDAEQAGFGLNDPLINGCNTVFSDSQGYVLAPALRDGETVRPLAAAVIEPGGEAPDRLTLYAGSATGGATTLRVTQNYIGGNTITVDRQGWGFALGDVIVVAPEQPGADCAMAQVSANPLTEPIPQLQFGSVEQRFNRGQLDVEYDGNTTRVFNLGPGARLAFHTWSVDGGYLRLRATDMAGAAENGQAVADNIVTLKAQYGFDTRESTDFKPGLGTVIGQWSSEMIDADGDGVDGGAGDYARIVALRIAVVARAKNPERPVADADGEAQCKATVEVENQEPVYLFNREQPQGVDAVPVKVDLAVAGDTVDWRCYRYRVFETIVPLRNASWSN